VFGDMEQAELEQIIEKARSNKYSRLDLQGKKLSSLPENIDSLTSLYSLNLSCNELTTLPESISNLTSLNCLDLSYNNLTRLPKSIGSLVNLKSLRLADNPLIDLSNLKGLSCSTSVYFINWDFILPRRYWTKFNNWKPEWLLTEDNSEIRRILIEQVGYEKIYQDLGAITLDSWREYTLLRIDGIQDIYDECGDYIGTEPTLLLKMTCPSTQHIHILRVPPEITSAEAAITWVNHGIHPDEIAVQT
jgi:leucine-rich repeat protein SHOC2